VDEARRTVWNLRHRPETSEDFVTAVSQLAQRVTSETGIPVRVSSLGVPRPLGAEGQWNLLMLVREAVQNAVAHAAPRNIAVLLTFDSGCLRVEIQDDGCGFETSLSRSSDGHHFGLTGMRERVEKLGGEFHLTSSPGKGTQLRLSIPAAPSTPENRPSSQVAKPF
jgi:signal transduction histidine kinase